MGVIRFSLTYIFVYKINDTHTYIYTHAFPLADEYESIAKEIKFL